MAVGGRDVNFLEVLDDFVFAALADPASRAVHECGPDLVAALLADGAAEGDVVVEGGVVAVSVSLSAGGFAVAFPVAPFGASLESVFFGAAASFSGAGPAGAVGSSIAQAVRAQKTASVATWMQVRSFIRPGSKQPVCPAGRVRFFNLSPGCGRKAVPNCHRKETIQSSFC